MKKIVIIGAGIAGLASAIRLAKMGFEVSIFEAAEKSGGKLAEFSFENYRFDAGPSLFTMPEWLDELTNLAGENFESDFFYEKLAVVTKYFWQDGTQLNAYSDVENFSEELSAKINLPKEKTLNFLANSKKIYNLTSDVFLSKSLYDWRTYCSKAALKGFLSIRTVNPFSNMHRFNAQFFQNEKAVQLFDRFATYNGSNPFQAPATLNVIPHLEHNIGAFFPKKGMRSIIDHLEKLAKHLGVQFFLGEKVTKILHEKGKITGIETEKRTEKAEIVIANADMRSVYRVLLKDFKAPEFLLAQAKSSSALIFYWAMKGNFPNLDLHNILFSENYKEEFDTLFFQKDIHHDPTVYIFISSKFCKNDAPENGENWFVMVNAPENIGQDWENIIKKTRQNIAEKIKKVLGINVKDFILNEQILDPRSIESRTSSAGGALYGNSSNNPYAAFLRHPNFSSRLKGLYFVGGSVHPGGGIPLCLLSAKICSEMVAKKWQ